MCWPHSPAVINAISSTAKTSGNKKDVGVSSSPRLSQFSGLSIAPI